MSHEALKRLGIFSEGDEVVWVPDDPFTEEENAVVVGIFAILVQDTLSERIVIRIDDHTRRSTLGHDGTDPVWTKWVLKSEIRHLNLGASK